MLRQIVLILLSATALVQAQSPVPDFTPPTPLFRAVLSSDAAETRQLLASGADPNEGRFLGAPPLIVALMQHADGAARELIAGRCRSEAHRRCRRDGAALGCHERDCRP